MDHALRGRLESFVRPLYQDLDGVSRFDAIERVAAIARRLYPAADDDRFELLLLFHGLGKWLEKLGNASRTALVTGLSEEMLRETAASIARLEAPASEAERAVAAAILVDDAGARGLAERLARSRREGQSVADVVRAALADVESPQWLGDDARSMLDQRRERRREFCRAILDETFRF